MLDDAISSSSSKTNAIVRAHLKDALVVGGTTVAPAGTPVLIRILRASGAKSGDVYGYVDIAFEPLHLPDGQDVMLRAPISHLTIYSSGGHDATVGVEDTVGEIFIPAYILYAATRKGRNVNLPAGTTIRARTIERVETNLQGAVVVKTPAPLTIPIGVPAPDYQPLPLAIVATPHPHVRNTPAPTPFPSPT